jgi:hypothetical protein
VILIINIDDITESQLDESPCKKSLESLFEEVTTPTKTGHQNEIATLSYISPGTKKLHSNILKNSPAILSHHNNVPFQVLQKNMLTNINYMIDYGQLMNNLKAAIIFDDMEKFAQDSKLKYSSWLCLTNSQNQKKDQLNFRHSLEKRRNLSPDLRDTQDGRIEYNHFL